MPCFRVEAGYASQASPPNHRLPAFLRLPEGDSNPPFSYHNLGQRSGVEPASSALLLFMPLFPGCHPVFTVPEL